MNDNVKKVWERQGEHAMSANKFIAFVAAFSMVGILWTAAAAYAVMTIELHWLASLGSFIAVLVLTQVGVRITLSSQKAPVSLAGYALVAIPFGLMIGPMLATFAAASVVKVLLITALIVVVLGTVGALYPKSLEHWGIYALLGLVILILGHLGLIASLLFGVEPDTVMAAFTWVEWIAVGLFGIIVVYDMNRAMRVRRTLVNSIHVALALYLDFLNIFINLLGTSK